MNAGEYKIVKQQAGSLNYSILLFTKNQLEKVGKVLLAKSVENIIQHNKLPFPEHHNKSQDLYSSFYFIDSPQGEIEDIVSVLIDLEAEAVETNTSPEPYASAADSWHNLIS